MASIRSFQSGKLREPCFERPGAEDSVAVADVLVVLVVLVVAGIEAVPAVAADPVAPALAASGLSSGLAAVEACQIMHRTLSSFLYAFRRASKDQA